MSKLFISSVKMKLAKIIINLCSRLYDKERSNNKTWFEYREESINLYENKKGDFYECPIKDCYSF